VPGEGCDGSRRLIDGRRVGGAFLLLSRGLLRSTIFPELYASIGYDRKEPCSIVATEIGLLPTPNVCIQRPFKLSL
jgi:hypothetical protein